MSTTKTEPLTVDQVIEKLKVFSDNGCGDDKLLISTSPDDETQYFETYTVRDEETWFDDEAEDELSQQCVVIEAY